MDVILKSRSNHNLIVIKNVEKSFDTCFFFLLCFSEEHGARFFEVSAEENINIEEALFNLAENMLNKRLSMDIEETSQNIRVSDTEEKKGRCY